jgi:hypothetical protein
MTNPHQIHFMVRRSGFPHGNPDRVETGPKVVDRGPPGPSAKGQDAIFDLTRIQSTAVTVRNSLPDRIVPCQRGQHEHL